MLEQEPPLAVPRQAPLGSAELRARTRLGLFLALVVFLGGCATAAEVTGTATQQDLMQLRADVAALQLIVQRAKGETDAANAQAERRTREQTAAAERQLAVAAQRLESLASTLATLSGRVDELNTRVETLNRQLRTGPPRSSAAPPAAATPATPATPTAPPASSATPAPGAPPPVASRPTTGSLQPQDIYQASYLDFSKGSYALAIAGFREFLRRFPEHNLAGNAQYWIGEAHYSLARGHMNQNQPERAREALEQAVTEFRRVLVDYPRGEKVPAALFKEALVLIDLKQPTLAQARLQYLIDNFPQAEETPLARDRLAGLKG
jgi:tol-pal system protein YbgF